VIAARARIPALALGAAAMVAVPSGRASAQGSASTPIAPAASILGVWRGSSICVKADWNASCNDEIVRYDFRPSTTHAGGALMHAEKMVNGAFEPMGDLEFVFDSATDAWVGDFRNQRVNIRWSFRVLGDSLSGQVVTMPDRRVARHAGARRDGG
jgi:hypothetical protein